MKFEPLYIPGSRYIGHRKTATVKKVRPTAVVDISLASLNLFCIPSISLELNADSMSKLSWLNAIMPQKTFERTVKYLKFSIPWDTSSLFSSLNLNIMTRPIITNITTSPFTIISVFLLFILFFYSYPSSVQTLTLFVS